MPQLKYYDTDKQKWRVIETEGNNVYFSHGEYGGRSLIEVINELKATIAGGSIIKNTFNFYSLNIEEDGQKELFLPIRIDLRNDAFLLFLNTGVVSSELYSLNSRGDSIIFQGELYAGDVLYLVVFKTVCTTPPDTYDGIIISEGSIQESKLGPALQQKINNAISSSEKGISLATLVDGKVPTEQLPNLDYSDIYAPIKHQHTEYALIDHTHDNFANKEDFLAHIGNTTLHMTESEKEALQHIQYNNEKKRTELEDANVGGSLTVQEYDVLDAIKSVQEKPSSNSKSITVSSTEPTNPSENDIWIVI